MNIFSLSFIHSLPLSPLARFDAIDMDAVTRKWRRLRVLLPRRRQLAVIAGLVLLAFLATGAVEVSTEMRSRPRRAQRALQHIGNWGEDITATLPVQGRSAWEDLVKQDPALMINICTVKLSSRR
ncbi:MAG: hypothetical protein RRC34_14985 [Lentisphaeria bacterium]|nr:hypothetical protein [Lentisphaeria bacterium]